MFNTFDGFIKKEVESFKYYGNFYEEAIKYIPSFFKLLCEMLGTPDIDSKSRLKINCALAYLVVPNDALPEDVYGAEGYMDDVFVLVNVLKELYSKHPDILKNKWIDIVPNDFEKKELESVLEDCYSKSKKVLEARNMVDRTLEFAGLKDI